MNTVVPCRLKLTSISISSCIQQSDVAAVGGALEGSTSVQIPIRQQSEAIRQVPACTGQGEVCLFPRLSVDRSGHIKKIHLLPSFSIHTNPAPTWLRGAILGSHLFPNPFRSSEAKCEGNTPPAWTRSAHARVWWNKWMVWKWHQLAQLVGLSVTF